MASLVSYYSLLKSNIYILQSLYPIQCQISLTLVYLNFAFLQEKTRHKNLPANEHLSVRSRTPRLKFLAGAGKFFNSI